MTRYIQELNFAVLTRQQELELFARIKEGDHAARNKFIERNLRFVVSVAKAYQQRGLELEDLISQGNIAMIKAIDSFDPARGTRFISFAVHRIRKAIQVALQQEHKESSHLSIDWPPIDSEDNSRLSDFLHSEDTADSEILKEGERFKIELMLKTLTTQEQDVIRLAFGLSHGLPSFTNSEIAHELKLSIDRVLRVKAKALKKLRG